MFHYSKEELKAMASRVLDLAGEYGATSAEMDVSESQGQEVQVRQQEIEQIEHQQDQSLEIVVYINHAKGRASTSDFSDRAIQQTVQAAVNIARLTQQDDCAGLADEQLMATEIGDLDVFHPWDISVEKAVSLAQQIEQAALSSDARVSNSEGANVNTEQYQFVYGNSHGFTAHQQGTRHSMSCSALAEDGSGMQQAYWYDVARLAADLLPPEEIGRKAAQRAVARLGARTVATGKYPIMFDATVSRSLVGHLVGALSGGALYRQTSFLMDSLDQVVMAPWVNLQERPHMKKSFSGGYFDAEGVATHDREVIESGRVAGYFLSSYSARKLGMETTANAGGAHNLILNHTHASQSELLKEMGTGLLITELMGQGVNGMTGDYSRGASGFWVENGELAYPVEELTIASRLQDMFLGMIGAADDGFKNHAQQVGSILIDEMTVAGSN